MKSYKKELWFNAPERVAFINITEVVEDTLEESGNGWKNLLPMNPSLNIFITEQVKITEMLI